VQERGPLTALRRTRALVVTAAVAAAVVAADQVTTNVALDHLRRPVHLLGPLGLNLQFNSGTAFSFFSGAGVWIVPVVLALLVVLAFLAWRASRTILAVAYGLVLGGAIGNLADRVLRGHHGKVVDYVTLSHWPTFNVADACITVGVVLLVAAVLTTGRHVSVTRATR
jgi:signal peptidase II